MVHVINVENQKNVKDIPVGTRPRRFALTPDNVFFFFQAEDCIRDFHVTGVQTCALPICDGQSFLFAETWGCSVKRHWFDGPKQGKTELLLANLPGFPDNINNSSDGHYWMSLVGMRCPALDLAWKMPGFRRRMAKRVPRDEWLFPNINTGCVLKFTERGEVLETLWDLGGENHPMITSMREHRGHLYLGGIMNNRIGKYKLENADPDFVQYDRRWGKSA